MLGCHPRFFGRVQLQHCDPEHILACYFDASAFWGNIEHVMQLTVSELLLYLRHAKRIRDSVKH